MSTKWSLCLALLVALGATSCRKLNIVDGDLHCSDDGQCPTGYWCHSDGFCYGSPEAGDGGSMSKDGGRDVAVGADGARDAKSDGAAGEGGSSIMVNGKQDNGNACGADGDCTSGFCRDGVCCNETCNGTCKACAATYTGGKDGVCANVMAGASSRGACADETATKPCGHDGTCDGAGQCKNVGAGQACGQPSCSDAHSFQPAATCDGAGACMTPAKMDCGTYPCATTGCAKPCMTAADCPAAQYCSNGTCKNKKTPGTNCATADECGSGFCSPDMVCCDKACTGACTACLKASTGQADGTCAPVQTGLDPHNDCAMDLVSSCGKDGACDGKGGCHLYASGMACAAGTCSGSTFTPGKTCNGTGMCVAAGSPMDCGQNACTTTGCSSSCKLDTDCGMSGYCDKTMGKCAGKKATGAPCSLGTECTTGACVDGVCCNSACTGKCVACSSAKTGVTSGTCSFITAHSDPDSECDASDASTCGQDGFCDGAGQCEKWPDGTMCMTSTCSAGNFLAARTCSKGACAAAVQTACGGAVCDPASGCRMNCATASDCTGNNYCDPGTKKCMGLKPNGMPCGAADGSQCMTGICADGVCCNAKCDGQCQSCAGGTCNNVKTPRTACGGTAPCAGSCTGTSSGCTFPGSTMSCGATGCADSTTANVPGTCNGGGTCVGATTKKCDFVCTGGGCGGNCHPGDLTCSNGARQQCSSSGQYQAFACTVSGQTCSGAGNCGCPASAPMNCGDTCVATNTDAHCGSCTGCSPGAHCCGGTSCVNTQGNDSSNCGACGMTCPSSSPACVSGHCKECGTSADCTSRNYFTCSNNMCVCRPQTLGHNLVDAAGFDGTVGMWDLLGSAGYVMAVDADGCPRSGSVNLPTFDSNLAQCISISAGAMYSFGFRFKGTSGGAVGACYLYYYDTNCSTGSMVGADGLEVPDTGTWQSGSTTITTPSTASQVKIYCVGTQGTGYFDQFFLNDTANLSGF